MFNYDKLIKKLEKFDELSSKKQGKVLESIFCSDEFRDWFYASSDISNDQPMTKPMVNKIFGLLAVPKTMKRITKFINNKTTEDFDHTSCSIAFLIVEQAIEISNNANSEISESYKSGELASKEAKAYKEKSEKYSQMISDLMDAIKDIAKSEVKEICKKSELPKGLVLTTYLMIPDRKYIPKFKIGMYVNQLLQEIYKWTGENGIEYTSSIKWGSYFGNFFGSELTSSAAISILLEGVRRIDAYRESDHFDNVREVWDSLTTFAMTELDKAPENIRRQMIEIYVKRIDRIFRNGNSPRLRVDLLNIPNNFNNLADTVSKYTDRIAKITRASARQVEDFQKQYAKPNKQNRDECDDEDANEKTNRPVKNKSSDDDEWTMPTFTSDSEDEDDED